MTDAFVIADNIISPLGKTTVDNFNQLRLSRSGIHLHEDKTIAPEPFYASLFSKEFNASLNNQEYTRFENLLIISIEAALKDAQINIQNKNTLFILSSTKGNIGLLETQEHNEELFDRISLYTSAKLINQYFGFTNAPLVVSNACISGVLGIITAMRFIQSGMYENVVVAGADLISKFILSGFQSFQAISSEPCKPFDINRTGITLGEGAATIVLSSKQKNKNDLKVISGATGNDANHISGPSRTGKELSGVIQKVLQEGSVALEKINFISAHGTATAYNDEMEAKAIALAGLQNVPVNSLKGYYGHTLGAAGLIESIITLQSMRENIVIPTKGFEQLGVSVPVNIAEELTNKSLNNCIKTASGFGGCNAAVLFGKV